MGAGKAYTPARAGFVGDAYTPANITADATKDRVLVSLNIAAPVMSVTDMRGNLETINRRNVYIYKARVSLFQIIVEI